MARVRTAVAAKDYPSFGILKGHTYWYWTPYRQGKRYSATPPRPSQVESNPTRSSYLALQETLEDALNNATSIADVQCALDDAAEEARGVADELGEKADNIEDGFQHPTEMSEQFREQSDEVSSWADDLPNAADSYDDDPTLDKPEEPAQCNYLDEEEFARAMDAYEEDLAEYEEDQHRIQEALSGAIEDARSVLSDAPDI
jgi:hypothetical protein